MTTQPTIPSRHQLEQLAQEGTLTDDGLEIALRHFGYLPDAAAWRRFGNLALLAAGSLLVLAGIVFFFAFNWAALHRFAKMALVALPLALSAALAARLMPQRAGQAWLGAAVVLTGVLLAVIGQIYQTGADSELLFAGWAALTLPWVAAGCAPWLWLFWLLIVNVALGLFIFGRWDAWMMLGTRYSDLLWLPLLLNASALYVWELLWPRLVWMRAPYAPRAIALLAALCATVLGVVWCVLNGWENPPWREIDGLGNPPWRVMRYAPLFCLGWLGATLRFYSLSRRDIVPLAGAALSLIIVVTTWLARWLFDTWRGNETGSFLLIGLAVAGMTALAAFWLRQTAQAWEHGA